MTCLEKRNLIVGVDDSNHAGDSKGELVVATFSWDYQDSVVREFPNVRDRMGAESWINSPERDYRFTLLTAEKYRHSNQNLVFVAPHLVRDYLARLDEIPIGIKLYLDGRLEKGAREHLRGEIGLIKGVESVVVDNFIKKTKTKAGTVSKKPRCPPVVYYADCTANNLYRNRTVQQLLEDPKFVLVA